MEEVNNKYSEENSSEISQEVNEVLEKELPPKAFKKIKNKQALIKARWKKGQSGNPSGRPKGQRNFLSIYRDALKKLADAKDMTPLELETEIALRGIDKALAGEYPFFKDIHDRIHGQATKSIDVTSGGKSMSEILDDLENKDEE